MLAVLFASMHCVYRNVHFRLEEHFGEQTGDEILPTIVESSITAPAVSSVDLIAVRIRSQTGGVSFFRIRSGRRLEILF
jgi:hypothetical protein